MEDFYHIKRKKRNLRVSQSGNMNYEICVDSDGIGSDQFTDFRRQLLGYLFFLHHISTIGFRIAVF